MYICMYMYVHVCTRTKWSSIRHVYLYVYVCTRTKSSKRSSIWRDMYMYICMYMYVHVCTSTKIEPNDLLSGETCMCICMYMYAWKSKIAYMHSYMHTYMRVCKHIHTSSAGRSLYIHACVCMYNRRNRFYTHAHTSKHVGRHKRIENLSCDKWQAVYIHTY